jgi:toxin ParE1/3/4
MSLPIRFLPEARAEYDAAVDWYGQRKTGLGVNFVARVRTVLSQIAADPQLHAAVHRDVRKVRVSRFPYVVLYREEPGEVIVISVFHTARDPSIWQSRV